MSETGDAEKTALMVVEQFGYCADEDFEIGCAGCLASHLVRILREEETPVADKTLRYAADAIAAICVPREAEGRVS